MTAAIDRARAHSEGKLTELRRRLEGIVPREEVVLTCGSYARREASDESDLDFFIIASKPAPADPSEPPWVGSCRKAISEIVAIEPAAGGAFSKIETPEQMLNNIGGDDDANPKITRRMLFLLEGEWLFNESQFKDVRRKMLCRYVPNHIGDHQLTLFLLNDIIRYYRTMAVDYEFKTIEGPSPKPWGIRNIKLVFSRKLLYCSGIFSVAKTLDYLWKDKISLLEDLFGTSVIDRMISICGRSQMEGVLASYDRFLEKFEDPTVRQRLIDLQRDERDDPLFREIKNEGHRFTRELMKLFEEVFDPTHPIRRAIIF